MKKTVHSRSRSRWLVGGILFIGAAALAGTGFSVWIVSNSVVETEGKVSIDYVDTAENQTVQLNATISDTESLSITEKYAKEDYKGNGTCYVTNNSDEDTDFEVTISGISVTAGTSYLESHKITGIEVTMYTWVNSSGNAVVWQPTDTDDDLLGSRSGDSYTYIELDTDTTKLVFGNDNFKTQGGSSNATYSYDNDWKVSFKWGSFFNGVSPCTYYNTVLNDENGVAPTIANLDNVTSELNTMHENLTDTVITLSIKLITE